MRQLSEHFTLEELTASGIALRKGIPNVPNAEQIANLTVLAQTLERIRDLLGPFHIDSAFRSPKVNAAVGSKAVHSPHLDGYAADIVAPGFGTPAQVCKAIESSGIPYDKLIMEGNWTHISIDPRARQQTFTAHFADGKVTYTQGIA